MDKVHETSNTAILITIGTAIIIVVDIICAHISTSKCSKLSSEPFLDRNHCVWYSCNALSSESVENLSRATKFPDGGNPVPTVHVKAGIVSSYTGYPRKKGQYSRMS
jgi:hypothetical protein